MVVQYKLKILEFTNILITKMYLTDQLINVLNGNFLSTS